MENFVCNIFSKKFSEYYNKIQNLIRFDFAKYFKFKTWALANFHKNTCLSDVTLIKSLYYQLLQTQPHSDLPITKRKYYYEIPANHSIDGTIKIYEFSYWLTK